MFHMTVAETLGEIIRRYRAEKGETQASLGRAIEVDGQTISNIEKGHTKGMKLQNLKRFSEVSGIPFSELSAAMQAATFVVDEEFSRTPSGVDTTRIGKTKPVPEAKTGIAAHPWVDRFPEDTGEVAKIPANSDGEVVLVVMGDCMAPKFQDGDRVIFSRKSLEREGIVDGKSYYIQLADDRATFKRVFVDHDDTNMYIFRCYNRKKFPRDIRVHRDQVAKMMRAVERIESVNF